ncbi:hypothetical protein [Vibrio sp. 10N.261.55.A7]|uniref:hypothetical protein n=1 Tax=Vibrio sp. 10N.261.55.A7 TaxID=1880851 RepID=UPI000C845B13|nr:hypothetical protein [Vibrio sp. 10N.261.55.A7]PMJ89828.1 hypothetical protein BCU12_01225 [Vibrio sp. 10N.261.55.A7]
MRVQAKAGYLIADLLFLHTKQDGDLIEIEFYRLNPHVRGEVFSEDCSVIIPDIKTNQRLLSATRSWN